jgi:hypothetical protein
MITIEHAKHLYLAVGCPNPYNNSEWEDIRNEMNAVVEANSDRAAAKTILWWGCWDRKLTATAFARRVRIEHQRSKSQ